MFRILTLTATAAIAASGAAAGQSDRYHDLRLDTSVTAIDVASGPVATTRSSGPHTAVLSSKDAKKKKPYAYINPYGVGPNNDSR